MTKSVCLVLFFSLSLASLASQARNVGPGDGGGGDALFCHDAKYYSYDYILTDDGGAKLNPRFVTAKSADEILESIADTMADKIPSAAVDLKDFIKSMRNTDLFDVKAKRVWSFGVNPLGKLNDQSQLRDAPNCKDASGKLKIFQTVVRRLTPRIEYNVDPTLIKELADNSPLQLSFLYIHEWLRDYTEDPTVIMKIDRMLHETDWLTASGDDVRTVFVQTGLSNFADLRTKQDEERTAKKQAVLDKLVNRYAKIIAPFERRFKAFDCYNSKSQEDAIRKVKALFKLLSDLEHQNSSLAIYHLESEISDAAGSDPMLNTRMRDRTPSFEELQNEIVSCEITVAH